MNPYILNIIGLTLDIIGVIGLFFYALPSQYEEYHGDVIEDAGDPEEEKLVRARNRKAKIRARISLGLIIAGFAFQLCSNLHYL